MALAEEGTGGGKSAKKNSYAATGALFNEEHKDKHYHGDHPHHDDSCCNELFAIHGVRDLPTTEQVFWSRQEFWTRKLSRLASGAREHFDDCCRSKAFPGPSAKVGDLILSLTWVLEGVLWWEFGSIARAKRRSVLFQGTQRPVDRDAALLPRFVD